jgi:hypothetical protein
MLAGAEHSCVMFRFRRNVVPLSCQARIIRIQKALKLQSVSPLYNAQQGALDVADARGGFWYLGFATTQHESS